MNVSKFIAFAKFIALLCGVIVGVSACAKSDNEVSKLKKAEVSDTSARIALLEERASLLEERARLAKKLTDEQKKEALFMGPFENHDAFKLYIEQLGSDYDKISYRRTFSLDWQEEEDSIAKELSDYLAKEGPQFISGVFIFDAVDVDGETKWLWRVPPEASSIDQLYQELSQIKQGEAHVSPSLSYFVLGAVVEAGLLKIPDANLKKYYLENISEELRNIEGVKIEETAQRKIIHIPAYEIIELFDGIYADHLECLSSGIGLGYYVRLRPLLDFLDQVVVDQAPEANVLSAILCGYEESGELKIRGAVSFFPTPSHSGYFFTDQRYILRRHF